MPRSPFIGASLRVSCADRLSACSLAQPPFQAFVHHNVIAAYDRFPAFPQKKEGRIFIRPPVLFYALLLRPVMRP